MSDPTLYQAQRLVQALELEDAMCGTWRSSHLVTLARQLVGEIEKTRMAEEERLRVKAKEA